MANSSEKEQNSIRLKRQLTTAGIVVLSACLIIVFYFCVARYEGLAEGLGKVQSVFSPIIFGFVLAFLINPFMRFYERLYSKTIGKLIKNLEKNVKLRRGLATVLALLTFIGIIALIFRLVLPEIWSTLQYLTLNIQTQAAQILDWFNTITNYRFDDEIALFVNGEFNENVNQLIEYSKKFVNLGYEEVAPLIINSIAGGVKAVFTVLVGIFVAIYVLLSKETMKGQAKKVIYGWLKPGAANIVVDVTRKSASIFYGFIIGKLVDSVIIGIICYICMLILGLHYAILMSVIIGITNIIPVFGPWIGAIPTTIILLLTSPKEGLTFLILVLILQQVDGNLIGPKILGDTTGISSFWVVLAVTVGGGLLGIPGMIVGVPLVAVIYYVAGRVARFLVRKKDLPEDTESYILLDYVDENNELHSRTPEEEFAKRIGVFGSKKNKKKFFIKKEKKIKAEE